MRLIHTFDDQKRAQDFSEFLTQEGINNECDMQTIKDWGSDEYGNLKSNLWIIEEDDFDIAQRWLNRYLQNPDDPVFEKRTLPLFEGSFENVKNPIGKSTRVVKSLGPVTLYFLMTCILLFIYGEVTKPVYDYTPPPLPTAPLYSPPINKALLYDYPETYEILDKLVSAYGLEKLQNLADLPLEGRILLEKYSKTPYWEGVYDKIIQYFIYPTKPLTFDTPWFEKIKQGEFWRLFTPALLHSTPLHLFFNMIWLVVLGRLIEEKIGSVRFLILVLIVGIISNTAQYLMSGPNFVGISGVICGMLGFIWARQRNAAWEGYNLLPGVISFMFFFVMAMLAIQLIAFIIQIIWHLNFIPGIANTAHIVGGLAGYLLGKLRVFSIKAS